MEKWKRLLNAGIMACFLAIGICAFNRVEARADVDPALLRNTASFGDVISRVGSSGSTTVSENAWKRVNGVCYNGSGDVVEGAITRGIDVSEWQGKINWKKVKASDIDFAFIRISSGTDYMDKYYDYNMKNANSVGLPVGTYVYSKATTIKQAIAEAQLAIEKMNGYTVSYPVVFDIEYSGMSTLSKKKVAKIALAFCNEIKAAGYTPMVYLNTDWYDNHVKMSLLTGIPVWIAYYSDTKPAPDQSKYTYGIWQCTSGSSGLISTAGLVSGIPAANNVDLDYGYVDYTQIVTPMTSAISSYVPTSIKEGWYTEDGKKYYYADNEKVTGWEKIDGQYYYFNTSNGQLCTKKLIKTNGKIYYVNKSGVRVSNQWVTKSGKTYYMGSKGYAVKGGRKIKGKYYYFDPSTRVMYKNQLLVRNNQVYYFGSDGARVSSCWKKAKASNGKTYKYYFKANGKAQKGWMTLKGKTYYFYESGDKMGAMAKNTTVEISGVVYSFNKKGVCQGKKAS